MFGAVVVDDAGGWVVAVGELVVGGEVVAVPEPFEATTGDVVRVLEEPATKELRFKVAAFEWNENRPNKPTTVPDMTIGARFIYLLPA